MMVYQPIIQLKFTVQLRHCPYLTNVPGIIQVVIVRYNDTIVQMTKALYSLYN